MTRTHEGDEGQITLPLIAFVLVMAAFALGMLGFGEASDSRGKAQKAADAAALGAAVAARDQVPSAIMITGSYFALMSGEDALLALAQGPAVGCAYATSWASRNDAALTGCSYRGGGRFRASTASEPSAERGMVGDADATADMNGPTCRVTVTYTSTAGLHEMIQCQPGSGGGQGVTFAWFLNKQYVGPSSPAIAWKQLYKIRLVD